MSAVPLAKLKQHVNITNDRDDAELQDTLDAAEAWVAGYIGSSFGIAQRTLTAHQSGRNLVLPAVRLGSVVSVTDPDGQPLELGPSVEVNLLSGIVRPPYRRSGPWTVEATFPESIDADLQLAVCIIAKHLWETQRVAGQPEGGRPGFSGAAQTAPSPGYAIPNRARTLLERFRQVPVA